MHSIMFLVGQPSRSDYEVLLRQELPITYGHQTSTLCTVHMPPFRFCQNHSILARHYYTTQQHLIPNTSEPPVEVCTLVLN